MVELRGTDLARVEVIELELRMKFDIKVEGWSLQNLQVGKIAGLEGASGRQTRCE